MNNRIRQFIKGMGSSIDLAGTSVPRRTSVGNGVNLKRSSADALGQDWKKLSEDLGSAFRKTVGEKRVGSK